MLVESYWMMAVFDAGEITGVARVKIRMVRYTSYEPMIFSHLLFLIIAQCMYAGKYLRVSAGTRTTCAIYVETDSAVDGDDSVVISTAIHCWGSRANASLDHFVVEERTTDNSYGHNQISLGQDHACVSGKNANGSSDSTQTSLECWWMAGSDFNAHRVPAGFEMVG